MQRERDAGGVLATIGAWLGAAAMVVAALLVLPFTGGPRLPTSPRTPPVTVTTPTTPATPTPSVDTVAVPQSVPTAPTSADTTPPPSVDTPQALSTLAPLVASVASRAILEPPAPTWPTVCGPITIGLADGPLADRGTELELEGAGGITVLTDVGTLEDDGVSLVGCA